ncbi:MAG: polymer-forming cytoskeletal protein [Deltaproteobacteria bacterium]|nr:polymer-forming cytoskeletal protein [Deltaproteobacteria bacterium]
MGKNNGGWLKGNKDQVNGLLDRGCSFEGKIAFDGTVQINGDFTGEISSEGTLVVGQEARVSGKVRVDTLICYGTVDGNVEAKSKIEIHLPSVVTADIATKSLSIDEGALFQGRCDMHHAGKAEDISSFDTLARPGKTTNGDGASREDQL